MNVTIFFLTLCFSIFGFANTESQTKVFQWVIAHEPIGLFQEASKQFSDEVERKTNGAIKIEVMTIAEYSKKYAKGKKITSSGFLKLLKEGKIHFSQNYTTELGKLNKDMYVLDLPFLFRDHQHAQHVLEGPVGEQLLAGLSPKHVRGLAFTYSGGYRILLSKKKLEKLEDFKNVKVRTSHSPVAKEIMKAINAKPVSLGLDEIQESFEKNKIEAAESTYVRVFPMQQDKYSPYIIESFHSLFLTAIIMNENVWKSFSETEQNIVKKAALRAARFERNKSLADTEDVQKKSEQQGIQLVSFDAKEKARIVEAMNPVYKKFESSFKPGLLDSIVKTN